MIEASHKQDPIYPVKEGGSITNYILGYMLWKPIGKGSFGIVWKARVITGTKKDDYRNCGSLTTLFIFLNFE